VTLIFSRWDKLNAWNESQKRMTLVTDGDAEIREGYDAEIAIPRIRYHGKEVGLNASSAVPAENDSPFGEQVLSGESTAPIRSLIICSKASSVLQGISSVKHRLDRNSVILFLQNGMGIVEEVSKEIFPDPATRPHYMLGINSHGVNNASGEQFTTAHAGFGTILLGILPHERDRKSTSPYEPGVRFTSVKDAGPISENQVTPSDEVNPEYPPPTTANFKWTPNQRYLLRTLLRAPVLGAAAYSPPDLLQIQLEKLAVNCIVNPLTVLLDARNGALLYNYALTRTMRLLLSEISLVIRSLPELQYIPNVQSRFDPGRLETLVVGIANKTKDNISSMLADARAGRQTEIDYINGWIVKRGEELGVRCLMNYMVMQMVKGKSTMVSRELGEGVPFVESRGDGVDVQVREGVAGTNEGEK
jgi:2-dehydropantoate 2-reductase